MAKVIEGLDETLKALRQYYPTLYKEMNKEIRPVMRGLVSEARSLVPDTSLSHWGYKNQSGKEPVGKKKARAFPRYDASVIKRGITFTMGLNKRMSNGWVTAYTLFNKSAVGAIYETAGRKNPNGSNKSGAYFIKAIQEQNALYRVGTSITARGRLIFQAVHKDEGHARKAIEKAIDKASALTQKKVA